MRRILGLAVLAAIAAAPNALEAQTPGEGQRQERVLDSERAPFAMLRRLQAELGLSAEQTSRLEGIRQQLRQRNEPLLAQLRASDAWKQRRAGAETRRGERRQLTPEQRQQLRERAATMTPEQRQELREQLRERRQNGERGRAAPGARTHRQLPEELRPILEQLRTNTRAALQEARAVLTPEQQARFRELAQQRRARLPGPRGIR